MEVLHLLQTYPFGQVQFHGFHHLILKRIILIIYLYPVILQKMLSKNLLQNIVLRQSFLSYQRVGVGKVALSHTSLCTSQDFCNIIDIKCHPVFLSYNLLRTMKRKSREVQGTSIKGITSDELQKDKSVYTQE